MNINKDIATRPPCQHCGRVFEGVAYEDSTGKLYCCQICKSQALYPRWPRWRYNGRRIVGCSIKAAIDLTVWSWRPRWYSWAHCFTWFCFRAWLETVYE